ncbi:hypothetical protein D3Z48_15035 [Clostridiaceae bacterium]|nr:hypothetical protein [Clostridiaceae bacterium]
MSIWKRLPNLIQLHTHVQRGCIVPRRGCKALYYATPRFRHSRFFTYSVLVYLRKVIYFYTNFISFSFNFNINIFKAYFFI